MQGVKEIKCIFQAKPPGTIISLNRYQGEETKRFSQTKEGKGGTGQQRSHSSPEPEQVKENNGQNPIHLIVGVHKPGGCAAGQGDQ